MSGHTQNIMEAIAQNISKDLKEFNKILDKEIKSREMDKMAKTNKYTNFDRYKEFSKDFNVWFDGTGYFGTFNKREKFVLHKVDMVLVKMLFTDKINLIDKFWLKAGNYYARKMGGKK